MTMPKFEPVAKVLVIDEVGRELVFNLQKPLYTADQLTEAYEAGKREASEDIEQETKMNFEEAKDQWMSHDEWKFADREACWKFMFEKGQESLRQQLAAMTAERDAYMSDYGNEQDRKREVAQQLSAALAACKVKDESLEGAHNGLRWWMDAFPLHVTEADNEEMLNLVKALAIQPDDAALRAWLGEPVARILKRVGEDQYQPRFGLVARTYAELPKDSYPDTWQELDELYSPKGLK